MHTHTVNQNGCAGGSHDDVVRGGGNAHTKNDAAQHSQKQGNDQLAVSKLDNVSDQLAAEAGHGNADRNHTGNAAGNTDGQGVLAAALKRVNELGRSHAVILIDQADHDARNRCIDRALRHRLTADDHVDQKD